MTKSGHAGHHTQPLNARDGTGKGNAIFDDILVAAEHYSASEAGLPGRADRKTIRCRSCGCETTADRICPACAEALRAERAGALEERCRIHRVRYVDDLPVSVLQEMQAERGRC